MAQTKQQLLDEAKKLGLKVDPKAKMADIRSLIAEQTDKKPKKAEEPQEAKTEVVTKAGKHSAKATREAEEEAAKKARNQQEPASPKAKTTIKPPRPKLERRSKGYKQAAKNIESGKLYELNQAIELVKGSSSVKFDASLELHVNLNVDPRQADQNIRDNVTLPAGSGKKLKVAALTDDPESAKSAGADIAGSDDLIQQIDSGLLDFDVLIATPALMPKLGKYARVLGPKGLMPNPKSGTVTTDVKKAVTEAKTGRTEYRVDSAGIVHLTVGKVSFNDSGLRDNVMAVISSIKANKPSSVKSGYLKSAYLATTMGPSINLDLASLNEPVS